MTDSYPIVGFKQLESGGGTLKSGPMGEAEVNQVVHKEDARFFGEYC